MSPGAPGPGTPKKSPKSPGDSPKTLSRHSPETLQRLPGLSPRLFWDFLGSRGRRPRETFSRLFWDFGPGGPERPLSGAGWFPKISLKISKFLFSKELKISQILQSRGPLTDPFRASGPEWGRKWLENGCWPHLEIKWGKWPRRPQPPCPQRPRRPRRPASGVLGVPGPLPCNPPNLYPLAGDDRKIGKVARKWLENGISGHSSCFPGLRPEMDLYEVHGIATQNLGISPL